MPGKMKAIIIDDEPLARDIIRNYLAGNEKVLVVAECSDGFAAIKSIKELDPDLIFLDIQMPKISGFELLELLDNPPLVIFATAFDQFAIQAFETNAVDYLLKPFSRDRFETALQKAMLRFSAGEGNKPEIERLKSSLEASGSTIDKVITKLGSRITVIPVNKIEYIEAQDDYVMVYSELGHHLKEKTMRYFEEHLPKGSFVRVHRKYIINIACITSIELYSKETHLLTLKSGTKINVSADGYKRLKQYL